MTLVTVAENFDKGYVSDISRDQIPVGAAYRMKDWLPEQAARLRGRGGWTFSSPDLNGISACSSIPALAWAPFPGDEQLVMVANNGKVFVDRNFNGATATFIASLANSGVYPPPFWHQGLHGATPGSQGGICILAPFGVVAAPSIYSFNGTSFITTTSFVTAPSASVGASYGDYLLFANGQAGGILFANRIWVSNVGDPLTFTLGTDFWDSVIPVIVSLVNTHNGILVFGYQSTSLIQGDTPPAGGNWSEKIIFPETGCWDVRSVAKFGDSVLFANVTGVYMTDGVTLKDLTAEAGVSQHWRELVGSFSFKSGWTAAGGIYQNKYIISVRDNTGATVTCHVFDLERPVAYELTNITAAMFAHKALGEGDTVAGTEALFAAPRSGTKVQAYHPIWTNPDNMIDADGTDVLPQIETPFYKPGGAGQKIFRSARATYDVRANGGSTPSLSVDYSTEPDGSYTNAGSLPTTTDEDRERVDIRERSRGIGLRLTQVGPSGHTSLSEIELDQRILEGMR